MISDASSRSILLLEDEELVSAIAVQMLEFLGFETVLAEEGRQAVEEYRQRYQAGEPFYAVIMDLSIPGGIGGKEAVKEVLEINPDAVVIVSSGYSTDPIMTSPKDYGFTSAISKPFNLADLKKVLLASH